MIRDRPDRVAFGEFELDPSSGDLTRRGRPVRLAAQPAKVLTLLVARAGELVLRTEIQQHVWGDTVVEQEQGLNACVRQIRAALGDRPEPPVFIETVPRRGYRFIAPVEALDTGPKPAKSPRSKRAPLLAAGITALALLALTQVAWRSSSEPTATPPSMNPGPSRAMLVVLPFDSFSPEAADESFSHGLTEELITELARLGPDRLGVISRTSAMQYKDRSPNLDQLGLELGVDFVLEGSVRRGDGVLRIVAQLIRLSDKSHVWAERFDRPVDNLLDVQLDVARCVTASLAPELLGDWPDRPIVNPEAWEAYLRGRYRLDELRPPEAEKALGDFRQALALDPDLAQAHVGISDAYHYVDVPDAGERRRRSIREALAIDPNLAAAHLRLGRLQLYADWDFEAAGRSLERAAELDPGAANILHAYAMYLSMMRRHDEAVAHMTRARELDPISMGVHGDGGTVYFAARRYEQAVESCRRSLELAADNYGARNCLLDAYQQLGRAGLALEQARALMAQSGASEEARRRIESIGDPEAALRSFYEWRADRLERQQGPPVAIAASMLPLGRIDEVFVWLELAFRQRSSGLLYIAADPRADRFRGDPRLIDLLRRIGFPDATIEG